MFPFFSIIIPIFNQKNIIKKGISNLINQSFKSYEIIIVDDGSTDGSDKVCDELQQDFSFIKTIHQTNHGSGIARNKGIELTEGEYICFFDIDDEIKDDWLDNINKLIFNKKPDVLIYSYKELNPQLETEVLLQFSDKIYSSNNEIRNDYIQELSGIWFNNGFVWNKVYKREFLIKNHIWFPTLRIQQDEVFNHKVYKFANTLITSSKVLYDYYIYNRGNTRNCYIPGRLKIFSIVKYSFIDLTKYWELTDKRLFDYIHLRFFRTVIYNRNPSKYEKLKNFRKELFTSDSLKDSVDYILENCHYKLSKIETLYLLAIKKKSKSEFNKTDLMAKTYWMTKRILRNLKIIYQLTVEKTTD